MNDRNIIPTLLILITLLGIVFFSVFSKYEAESSLGLNTIVDSENKPIDESNYIPKHKHTPIVFVESELKSDAVVTSFFNSDSKRFSSHKRCLAKNIFYEARGTSFHEKLRVINVTFNRANSKKYPSDICGVIMQHAQFSWTLNEKKKTVPVEKLYKNNKAEMKEWEYALSMADAALRYGAPDITKGAMYYHTHYVSPYWNKHKKKAVESKWHIYYK
jgi:spore germination cell wall hydrolase CwlJ-like protein